MLTLRRYSCVVLGKFSWILFSCCTRWSFFTDLCIFSLINTVNWNAYFPVPHYLKDFRCSPGWRLLWLIVVCRCWGYVFIVDFSLQYNLWELDLLQEAGIYNNMNFHKTVLIQSSSNENGGNLWPIIQLMQLREWTKLLEVDANLTTWCIWERCLETGAVREETNWRSHS